MGPQQQMVGAAGVDLQNTRVAVQANRPAVAAILDRLHAGHGPIGEKRHHAVPVERRLEREPHRQSTIGGEPVGPPTAIAQFCGRGPEHLAHLAVELAQAPEPGGERHLRDRQVGVVQEPASEVGTTGSGQLVGSHAEVVVEQPAQVPRRDRETRSEAGLRALVQCAVNDQLHRATHQLG